MSDVAQVALITGGIGLASLLATLWFNARRSATDREARLAERRDANQEWYRRTLFDRRLAAIHEAGSWLIKMGKGINRAESGIATASGNKEALLEVVSECEDWYGRNVIYLHGVIPETSAFTALLSVTRSYAEARGPRVDDVGVLMDRASDELNELAETVLRPAREGDR